MESSHEEINYKIVTETNEWEIIESLKNHIICS